MADPTESKVPLRDRDQPVALSGSALDQLANTCALQWFLSREVKADAPATAAQGFGNVVHVLADEVASGRSPADLAVLMERLDTVWNALAFDAPWKSAQEKEHARVALERFLNWHVLERAGRTPVAGEHDFDVTLEAGGYQVRIRGSMDRVEADVEGRAYVVDFKTGKQAPTGAEVARHPQLAVYQLAVREGAVDEVFDGERPEPGGAELVQLRQGAAKRDGGDDLPKVQTQEPLEGSGRRAAGHRRREGSRRAVHADGRAALRALRLPGVLQRAAGGTPHCRVTRVTNGTTCADLRVFRPRRPSGTDCQCPPLASVRCPPVSPIPSSSRSSSGFRSPRSRRPASSRRPPRR